MRTWSLVVLLLITASWFPQAAQAWNSDYELYALHSGQGFTANDTEWARPIDSSGTGGASSSSSPWLRQEIIRDRIPTPPHQWSYGMYTAHTYAVANPLQHVAFLPPWKGCGHGLATPKATSDHYPTHCRVALNGGFFNPYPPPTPSPKSNGSSATKTPIPDSPVHECIGNIVSDGREVQWEWEGKDAGFGIAYELSPDASADDADVTSTNPVIVTGYVNTTTKNRFRWLQYVSGYGWLVRGGQRYVSEAIEQEDDRVQRSGSGEYFRNLKAPRSAIGHDMLGRVVVVVVDGQEDEWNGVSLDELAEILVSMGIINAINIDGGGSTSVYVEGQLVNVPSDVCPHTPTNGPRFRCPREVASIICLTDQSMQLRPRGTPTLSVSASELQSATRGNHTPSRTFTVSATASTTPSATPEKEGDNDGFSSYPDNVSGAAFLALGFVTFGICFGIWFFFVGAQYGLVCCCRRMGTGPFVQYNLDDAAAIQQEEAELEAVSDDELEALHPLPATRSENHQV